MVNKVLLVLLALISIVGAIKLSHKNFGHRGYINTYVFDEAPKQHQCTNDNECAGSRKCSQYGWCQGEIYQFKNQFYSYPTGKVGAKCSSHWQCDGKRDCYFGDNVCKNMPARRAKDPLYVFNEAATGIRCPGNPKDFNYAVRDWYCNGQRTCSEWGWCQGETSYPKNATYYRQEFYLNQCHPSSQLRDYQCDGNRVCDDLKCTGTARPPKDANYVYDEASSSMRCPTQEAVGNYAIKDYFCTGLRTCSAWGWCQGSAK